MHFPFCEKKHFRSYLEICERSAYFLHHCCSKRNFCRTFIVFFSLCLSSSYNDSILCMSRGGRSVLSCKIMWHFISLSPATTFLPCYIPFFLIPRFFLHFISIFSSFSCCLPECSSSSLLPLSLPPHARTHALPSRNPSCQCMCVGVL